MALQARARILLLYVAGMETVNRGREVHPFAVARAAGQRVFVARGAAPGVAAAGVTEKAGAADSVMGPEDVYRGPVGNAGTGSLVFPSPLVAIRASRFS